MLNKSNKFTIFVLVFGVISNLITPQTLWAVNKKFTLQQERGDQIFQTSRLEVNLSHRQVSLYLGKNLIRSYPIAVGRRNWETPVGKFQVLQLLQNPKWIHPMTGKAIAGGTPDNPLGKYWIGFWTNGRNWVGFHGTPNPETVGKEASHGCLRMYNKDIEELFQLVSRGTPVTVVK